MKSVAVLLFCSALASGQAPAKPLTPAEQQQVANEQSFIAAAKKGDKDYFKRTLTDDFSSVAIDGELYNRQESIDQIAGGGIDVAPYNFKVVVISDTSAIVTYDAVFKVPPTEDQGPPPRYQHFSSVWVKQGDAWKLKFQQTTASHWGDW